MARRIPFIPQMEISDCGAACLAMTLAYHGRREPLERVREATGGGRDGVHAQAVVEAARRYGLAARGVRADLEELQGLPPGSILHWGFNHFLVLERITRRGVRVVDPALGRRLIPMSRFRRSYTGVAIVLEPTPDFVPGGRPRSIRRHLRPLLRQRGLLGRVLVISVVIRALLLALPLFTAILVNQVIPQGGGDLLAITAVALGFVVVYHFASSLLRERLLVELRTRIDVDMTRGLLDHLVGLPYGFFLRRSSGDLMSRMASIERVREILATGTLTALIDGALVVLYLGLLLAFDLGIGLVTLALGLLQIVVVVLAGSRNRLLSAQSLEASARVSGYEYQLLAGIETLKAAGVEQRALAHWRSLFADKVAASLARGRLAALVDAALDALGLGAPLCVLMLGGLSVLSGQLPLGTMLGLVALAEGFLKPLVTVAGTGLRLQQLRSYLERIDDVLDVPREQEEGAVKPAGRLSGHVRAENVVFRYAPLSPPAVDDVSLEIHPGQRVAIVGRSGSGKSTLAALLLGLHRPTSGSIRFDGVDLRELDLGSVRRQIGIVTQHPYLFSAPIRDNIALTWPEAPLEAVIEAARIACIDEEIAALPMGYETVLAGAGASLSGGQRQRIALARAVIRRPRILLLDEATSALDAVTEHAVHQRLAELGCTIILIAHRVSTLSLADLILVMEGGRIVERGDHTQLLRLAGRYRQLVTTQSRSSGE
jgi:ATP-binding cassette subfamily B protein